MSYPVQYEPERQPGSARLRQGALFLSERYPSLFALLMLVVLWGLPAGVFALLHLVLPQFGLWFLPLVTRDIISEAILALEVVGLVSWLGWWPRLGFTGGMVGKTWTLYILPFLLIVLGSIIYTVQDLTKIATFPLVMFIFTCLMIGFVEEVCFRGIILGIVMPRRGIMYAVLFSSLLFGCFHSINLLSGFPPLYVLGEAILGVGLGVLFAALRLRSNSIWPVLLMHGIRDLPGIILLSIDPHRIMNTTSTSVIVISVYSFLLLLNALFLLRPKQLAKLRIAYGLAPAPVSAVPPPYTAV